MCHELHIGNTPRSIMTKGTSTRRKNRLPGSLYGNCDLGNNDKLMITYRREPSHDYTLDAACGVLFEGEMHFFGGFNYCDLPQQHFVIETQRSGQLARMTRKQNLEIGFRYPSCSSFDFPWSSKTVAILCFDENRPKSCYSFDGKLTYVNDSVHYHLFGKLAKYSGNLLTVGGGKPLNQNTEIMKINEKKIQLVCG